MSVSLTEDQVVAEVKDVTRRLGWAFIREAEVVTLCRKVMGRRRADGTVEPLIRLKDVRVVSAHREKLSAITDDDVIREGFGPDYRPDWWVEGEQPTERFIEFFTRSMRCHRDKVVTRIEWAYLAPGSWIDNQGDVWTLGADGLMHTPETAPFPREHVEKKWGPLRPVTGVAS